jgi:copper resistance protein D
MAGFVDVVLRGLALVFASLVVGGLAWIGVVLGAHSGSKPDPPVSRALRVVAVSAALIAATQVAVVALAFAALGEGLGPSGFGLLLGTTFARVALARVVLAIVVTTLAARLARRPAGRPAWLALSTAGTLLVASSAVLSHAIARVGDRGLALALDAAHQLGAAVWVGGLAHLTLHAARDRGDSGPPTTVVVRRFSALALGAMIALLAAGAGLSLVYVGDAGALLGTAYGVMVLSKVTLLAAVLGLAAMNFRLVRRAAAIPDARLFRFVEVELGLGVTLLFAAASLTSLPPAVDVREDRASVAEVIRRYALTTPRLSSPRVDELIRTADPLMAGSGQRTPIERAWSEYNHHWAGLFVLAIGALAGLERVGVRPARHWPLVFLGLAAFLFVRNDPRAWPLGPAGFWESLTLPDVLQHRAFVLLVVAFGVFEWQVRTGRIRERPWAYVFPLLCAVGGGLLLTHSHAMFSLKEEFLTEVTHAPLGLLGAFAGWGRWLEIRLPESKRVSGWIWTACVTAVGALLLGYREG